MRCELRDSLVGRGWGGGLVGLLRASVVLGLGGGGRGGEVPGLGSLGAGLGGRPLWVGKVGKLCCDGLPRGTQASRRDLQISVRS